MFGSLPIAFPYEVIKSIMSLLSPLRISLIPSRILFLQYAGVEDLIAEIPEITIFGSAILADPEILE
jgi:hypothetical protein